MGESVKEAALSQLEEAEPIESYIPAQQAKGIMVDDEEYFPVHEDWALGYADIGGEG